MNQHILELPWTDEQWARIRRAVSEEAQRARVAAKFLPIYGPIDAKEVAVPSFTLSTQTAPGAGVPPNRHEVDSQPTTQLVKISSLVYIRTHEAADPELQAAIGMFRRAASIIARTEDALMFNGRDTTSGSQLPPLAPNATAPLQTITGPDRCDGLLQQTRAAAAARPTHVAVDSPRTGFSISDTGTALVSKVVEAINKLDGEGYTGPYACVLSDDLYEGIHTPTSNLVLPRHTILPLLEDGPLLRSSRIRRGWGIVVAHESGQVEQVLASDISVKLLQVSLEPRFVFRLSERVALRVRDRNAVAVLHP